MKTAIYLIMIVILISSVYAVRPQPQISQGLEGLEIRTLNLPSHTLNTAKTFKVHVFNYTNDLPVINGLSCDLHLYNTSYNHIAEVRATIPEHIYDYEMAVGANNFSKVGNYPYIVQCNTSLQGGFYADYLEVSINGQPFQDDKTPIIIIILLPILFAAILIFGAVFMGDEHPALKIFIFLLIPILFFSSMHFGLVAIAQLYNLPALQETIGDTIYWIGIITGVIITYFIIYFIYKGIRIAAQDKEDKINY